MIARDRPFGAFQKKPALSSMYRRQPKRFAGRDSRPLGDGDGDGNGDVRKRERIIWPRQPTGLNAFELVGSCLLEQQYIRHHTPPGRAFFSLLVGGTK